MEVEGRIIQKLDPVSGVSKAGIVLRSYGRNPCMLRRSSLRWALSQVPLTYFTRAVTVPPAAFHPYSRILLALPLCRPFFRNGPFHLPFPVFAAAFRGRVAPPPSSDQFLLVRIPATPHASAVPSIPEGPLLRLVFGYCAS